MAEATMTDTSGPGPLGLILLDGRYERVHYGLAMAASALAIGRSCVIFFTNHALHALLPVGPDSAGWGALAGDAQGHDAATQDKARQAAGVAGIEELLAACAALGARFIACEMGLRVAGLAAADLRNDIAIEVAGLVTLYNALDGRSVPVVL